MRPPFWCIVLSTGMLGCSYSTAAQTLSSANTASQAEIAADYPKDRAGVLILSPDWVPIVAAMPAKVRTKRGVLAGLSYGAVPANVVAEYEGLHAQMQVPPGQPVICICHILSLPGDPVIVRLRPKKASRELDGGKMTVYPVVGGSKMAEANKSDVVPADVSHPQETVWLVRPREPLPDGEYALMLGTRNLNIFPFTVSAASTDSASHRPQNRVAAITFAASSGGCRL